MGNKLSPTAVSLAKVSSPRLHQVVARERLFKQLDQRAHIACTWIQAPPGSGKTTLAGSYIEARELPVLWYQFDGGDADPSAFFHYLARAAPGGHPELPALTPEYLPDVQTFSRRFFRLLFERLGSGAVVVLDNYQELPAACLTQNLVALALDEVPPGSRVLIMSRQSPPAALIEQQARAGIDVLPWEDLKLSVEEVGRMGRLHGVSQASAIEAIHKQCDGWAAGVTLMMQSARLHPRSSPALQIEGRERIFAYFAQQLLSTVSEDDRRSLELLSLLPQFTVEMASALTLDPNVARVVEDLFHRQIFIHRRHNVAGESPDDSTGDVKALYQFHALFEEYLSQQLAKASDAQQMSALRTRAAVVLEANGFVGEALDHYHAAKDWGKSVDLIIAQAPTLNADGRWMSLVEYIERLPLSIVEADMRLQYWQGTALLAKDLPRSRSLLRQAFQMARAQRDTMMEILSISGIIWGLYLEGVSMPEMAQWIPDLERLCAETAPTAPHLEVMAQFALHTAALWARPDHPALPASFARLQTLFALELDPNQKCMLATSILNYMAMSGQVDAAYEFGEQYERSEAFSKVSLLNELSFRSVKLATFHKSFIARYQSQLDAILERAIVNGLVQPVAICLLVKVIINAICGADPADGLVPLRQQSAYAPQSMPLLFGLHRISAAFYYQGMGDVRLATEAARDAYLIAQRLSPGYLALSWGTALAGLYAAGGEHTKADEVMGEVTRIADSTPFRMVDAGIALTRAYMYFERGDSPAGKRVLQEAMRGLRDSRDQCTAAVQFVHVTPRALALALEHSIEPATAIGVIQEFHLRPPPTATEHWPWSVRIRALGAWEIQVDSVSLAGSKKLPAKLSQLLHWLLLLGGKDVEVTRLHDALWPEMDGDQAQQAFTNALHRLRRILGKDEVLILHNGRLSLDSKRCWTDLKALADLDNEVSAVIPDGPAAERLAERLLSIYRGKLVPADNAPADMLRLEDRYRTQFARIAQNVGSRLEQTQNQNAATGFYGRVLAIDDSLESIHKSHIRVQISCGSESGAREALRRCEAAMMHHFGRAASKDVRALLGT